MGAFFLAMALYPEVQKKAQAELDAVVGSKRFPDFPDRPSLPYVNALVKELFRWHPATPIGAPHRVVEHDEYNGYLIPGGATVFVNMWCVHSLRWLTCWTRCLIRLIGRSCATRKSILSPTTSSLSVSWTWMGTWTCRGEIPRMSCSGLAVGKSLASLFLAYTNGVYLSTPDSLCPGRVFAESTLFILCASVLAAFEIGPPVDKKGIPIDLKREATDHWIVS